MFLISCKMWFLSNPRADWRQSYQSKIRQIGYTLCNVEKENVHNRKKCWGTHHSLPKYKIRSWTTVHQYDRCDLDPLSYLHHYRCVHSSYSVSITWTLASCNLGASQDCSGEVLHWSGTLEMSQDMLEEAYWLCRLEASRDCTSEELHCFCRLDTSLEDVGEVLHWFSGLEGLPDCVGEALPWSCSLEVSEDLSGETCGWWWSDRGLWMIHCSTKARGSERGSRRCLTTRKDGSLLSCSINESSSPSWLLGLNTSLWCWWGRWWVEQVRGRWSTSSWWWCWQNSCWQNSTCHICCSDDNNSIVCLLVA